MSISIYTRTLKTLADNTKFWQIVDYLRSHGKRVKVDMPNVMSGNLCSFECHPYPHPDELAYIKPIMQEIERLSKVEKC